MFDIDDFFIRLRFGANLLGCVGSAVLIDSLNSEETAQVVDSLGSDFFLGLRAATGGGCVDEFMMLQHSKVNLNVRKPLLLSPVLSPIVDSVVLAGSGPSLDQSIAQIPKFLSSSYLISAGSSIGSLLGAGLSPHFHVHLERGGHQRATEVYSGLLSTLGMSDFGATVAVAPTSIDPSLLKLYKTHLFYARSGQTPVCCWPFLEPSVLPYEGPQSLSAAFSFAMWLKPKRIYLFGCDLGCSSAGVHRSAGAVGKSERQFPLAFPGNFQNKAFTSESMLLQLKYMKAAYLGCGTAPEVINFSDGIRIPFSRSAAFGDVGSDPDRLLAPVEHLLPEFSRQLRSSDLLGLIADSPDVWRGLQAWLSDWASLACNGPELPIATSRLIASNLLSPESVGLASPMAKVFRGTLRDAFWLLVHVVENYPANASQKTYCWSAFARCIQSLSLEAKFLEQDLRR